ncbi:hypothetical protein H0481_09170 [Escherichia coli]|uniref:hypothetical protein n=1 Tax=Escherichia coli TaxID=562 RepID=UPI0015EC1655|nr:hypothetical protein [Escherichia coli]EGB0163823.1 hypothetical protein [Escherichia coli]QLQ47866.1 hypothetical protein H0481_09170 [Escherichia coli]HCJ9589806.1 hypothetical protein [Escherichia coli]
MFEKMKNNVTRIPGNLTKLNQYQKDIDHLSKLFSEQQLLELMTTTESDQILQMKPAVDILHVLSPSASTAKHINFFQHVPVLEQWLKKECTAFNLLAVHFYSQQSRKNVIPKEICMLLDAFIKTELSSAVNGNNNAELLSCFQNTLDKMCNTLTFIDHTVTEQSGQVAMLDFSAKMHEYTVEIRTFLKSEYWLNKLPKDINIPAIDLSWLVFCYFCSEYHFVFIQTTLNTMKAGKIIRDNYLYHPKMIALIILSMLPYEVIHNDESLSEFKTPLTSPDEFIIKSICIKGKQNTTGHKKDIEQLLRKTYIYIALLLNPEWAPSSKELISFLSGKSTVISGSMNFQSTSSGLGVQTNNITLLKNEVYFEKIANKIMKL